MFSLCPFLSLSFVTEAGIRLGSVEVGWLIKKIRVGKVSCREDSSDGAGARVGVETGHGEAEGQS